MEHFLGTCSDGSRGLTSIDAPTVPATGPCPPSTDTGAYSPRYAFFRPEAAEWQEPRAVLTRLAPLLDAKSSPEQWSEVARR